jgi:putative aldouronate transport system substrate-binding protein
MNKRVFALSAAVVLTIGMIAGCGGQPAATKGTDPAKVQDSGPMSISLVIKQVNDIPAKGNPIEQDIEKYTNTKLDFQWIPGSAYDDKINLMIAAGELPMIMKVSYVPTIIASIQSGMFWEVGPYLKDYKNLSAQNSQYYDNIQVDGKLFGIPLYREIGRPAVLYRKDLFDNLGLKLPKTLDEYYNVFKALTLDDPDKNGKNDTYGLILDKGSAETIQSLATSQGAPNDWGFDNNGKVIPSFMHPQFFETLKLLRRVYAEKLINQDFPALAAADADKQFESGRAGMKLNGNATNATNIQDRISKVVPTAQMETAFWEGPGGIRIAGQAGNNGLLVFPKSTVKTEADLKKLLTFLDKLLDEPMSTLQKRGIEGVHFIKNSDNTVSWKDLTAFNREVKPYRDNLLNFETYNVAALKDTPLAMKSYKMEADGVKYSIPNPTLTLSSKTFSDRGKELKTMMEDAATNYIIGKLDDAGWQGAISKWRTAGGDLLIKEFEDAYAKNKKK